MHRAIDQNFPNAAEPPRQFTKTVFADGKDKTGANDLNSALAKLQQDNIPTDEMKPKSGAPGHRSSKSERSQSPATSSKPRTGPTVTDIRVSSPPSKFSGIDPRAFRPTGDYEQAISGQANAAEIKRAKMSLRIVVIVALCAGAFLGFLLLLK